MKLVTQLRIVLIALLMLGIGSVVLSWWGFAQSRLHIERVTLAKESYYLLRSLESHTYQLFKQYGDALIIGGDTHASAETELIDIIRAKVARLRALMAIKATLGNEGERSVPIDIDPIEEKIERLISSLREISTAASTPDWEALSNILDHEIDQEFRGEMRSTLALEADEMQNTLSRIDDEIQRYEWFSVIFAIAASLAAFVSIAMLNRQISKPVEILVKGVHEFGSGNLDYRTNLNGSSEIDSVGQTFDLMAQRISEKTKALASEKDALTEMVAERTRQLEDLLAELRRSDANRRQMIADVSHELRTPLTIIKGEADVALRGADKSSQLYRDALERTREAASHTARIVDDLLFVARSEAGHVRLNRSHFDLVPLVMEVIDTFGRGVTLNSELIQAPIEGDQGRIRQAMLVLLENARHHGGRQIEVQLSALDTGYVVAVNDNGQGMTDEIRKRAFERYYRGANAAERYAEGAGLGLPVALSIAKAHDGTISLQDRPGGGLIASLHLPTVFPLKMAL